MTGMVSRGVPKAARERKFVPVAIDKVNAAGTFSGYASLFGKVDLARDAVERGAFTGSLARRGHAGVRMLFQHDPGEPIGVWEELREDRRGLFVRGRLSLGSARAREVHALMRSGALDGLSIGFRTIKARTEPGTGVRRILQADLWEISVVTFPMLPGARVELVKGMRKPKEAVSPADRLDFQSDARLAAAIRRAATLLKQRNRHQ